MRPIRIRSHAFVLLTACLFHAASAEEKPRSVELILRDLAATKFVPLDPTLRADEGALRAHKKQLGATYRTRDALILELYRVSPAHPKIPALMSERWGRMGAHWDEEGNVVRHETLDDAYRDIDAVLANNPTPELRIEALAQKAMHRIRETRSTGKVDFSALHELARIAPGDPQTERIVSLPFAARLDPAARAAIEDQILAEFPDARYAERIRSERKRLAAVGKPFQLAFKDAVTGAPVSIQGLKGKVVVLDFWATWCAPCVAELPRMKELYRRFRDRGVEFIGVSLDESEDEGGLEKLRAFVAKNGVPWPQYYQGNGTDSSFSTSWGIHAIPWLFVIDREGRLYSADARRELGALLEKLTGEADALRPERSR
jgi:thiol-disulfide isomerase/thioredoxin